MESRTSLLLISGIIIFGAVGFAADEAAELPEVPYIAEVVGQDVYVRAGAGTAYYHCTKVNAPQRVMVVGHKYGYSKIVPPKDTFSWISKDYIQLDSTNENIGIVNGDSVRVRAGAFSDEIKPSRAYVQTKLDEGDTVKLLGVEREGFYKIAPPVGAYLYIKSDYLKYLGSADKVEIEPKAPEPEEPEKPIEVIEEEQTPVDVETVVEPEVVEPEVKVAEPAVPMSTEAKRTAEIKELEEQIKAENAKPLGQQDYSELKGKLEAIAADKEAGKAPLYAKYYLDQIDRFELAKQVNAELARQDAELATIREQIRQRRQEKLKKISGIGKYIVTGKFKASQVYTGQADQKRYVVIDNTGKIICYAIACESLSGTDIDGFEGKKVGLTGTAGSDPYSPASLVEFTSIELLK